MIGRNKYNHHWNIWGEHWNWWSNLICTFHPGPIRRLLGQLEAKYWCRFCGCFEMDAVYLSVLITRTSLDNVTCDASLHSHSQSLSPYICPTQKLCASVRNLAMSWMWSSSHFDVTLIYWINVCWQGNVYHSSCHCALVLLSDQSQHHSVMLYINSRNMFKHICCVNDSF